MLSSIQTIENDRRTMMKKIVALSILATLFATADVYSAANSCCVGGAFEKRTVGIEIGATSIKGDTGKHGTNYDGGSASFGLRLGAQTGAWRSMFLFDFSTSDDEDQTYERLLMQMDYFIQTEELERYSIRPYIGANLGYLNYDSSKGIGDNGFTMGGQAGALFSLTPNWSLDLAYRYNIAIPDELDSIGSLSVGLDYSF